jgi:hypothetical protein
MSHGLGHLLVILLVGLGVSTLLNFQCFACNF